MERTQLDIRLGSHRCHVVRTYAESPAGSLVALFGSSGRLELARVNGNAAGSLQCQEGDEVVVAWRCVGYIFQTAQSPKSRISVKLRWVAQSGEPPPSVVSFFHGACLG